MSTKKRLFGYLTTQTVITFFLFIFIAFLFIKCDSCIVWEAFQKMFIVQHGVLNIGTYVKCLDDLK